MTPRRNRVTEHLAATVAYVSGSAAAFSPASPTGRPLVDAALVGLSVAGVVYAAASAPWWALGIAAGVALAAAINPILIALALVAFALAMWVGARKRDLAELRAVSAGLSLNVLAWAELEGFFGLTALLGIAAAMLLFVTGIDRRPRAIRRRAWQIVGVTGVVAAVAAIGFGLAAAGSRADLQNGNRLVNEGINALNQGDFDIASDRLTAAATALGRAEDQLGQPWGLGGSLVPVVAQHRSAALDLSSAGAAELAQVAAALDQINPDELAVTGGQIDLAAVAGLAEPFGQVDQALDRMAVAAAGASSPWLIPPIGDEVDALSEDIAENAPKIDNAVEAVRLAPVMLGRDEPQVYLLLFTSPAEARGLGGFIGNYAELTITGGKLELSTFGRVSDLEAQAQAVGARVAGPAGFLERYGRFGFNRDGSGAVGNASFRNLTMTPNFPWVGDVATQLYSQVTGRSVDGVIALDAYVIQALLAYTGPIQLTEYDVQLTSENAAEYILRTQYELGARDNVQRIDALAEAAELTTNALLSGSLPEPTQLARDLGPLAADRRLLVWTGDPEQQELLRQVNLLGEIPSVGDGNGWSVAVNNGSGNKIEAYLERAFSYTAEQNDDGTTTAVLRAELTNTAPATGLPTYVIGNAVGLPMGTNRLYVSAYSPLALTGATVDGEVTGMEIETEAGWNVYSRFVDIPPGGTVVLEWRLHGAVPEPSRVVTWTQPLVSPPTAIEPGEG
jgi:hypothetical protein